MPEPKPQNWKPIKKQATDAAEKLGHKLTPFQRQAGANTLLEAFCERCLGWCWIMCIPDKEYSAGGRLLKYRCGTPEAAGFKKAKEAVRA